MISEIGRFNTVGRVGCFMSLKFQVLLRALFEQVTPFSVESTLAVSAAFIWAKFRCFFFFYLRIPRISTEKTFEIKNSSPWNNGGYLVLILRAFIFDVGFNCPFLCHF